MKRDAFTLPKRWPVGVAGATAASFILNYFTGTDWPRLIVFSMLAAAGAFVALFFIARYDARLAARMEDDASFVWGVWMNGVKIGSITDAQYAAIQRHAFGNARLVVAQVLNLGHVALYIAGKVFVSVPLLMFWLAVATVALVPESIIEIVQVWRTAEPAALVESLRNLFHLVATVSVVAVGVMVTLGYRFGFCNHYDQAVADMIRRQCNTPTEGSISLSKIAKRASGEGRE